MKTIANGIYPVMITPFTAENKIDWTATEKLVEWYAKEGCTGIFAVCQSSEMHFLNKQERYDLAKFVIEKGHANGLTVVASGHVAEKVSDQISEAQAIVDAGVDAYVFLSNQFAKEGESEDVAKKSIETLISNINAESFGVYECPKPYKRLMSPELLKWCAETGKFAFLKDTCCDLAQLKAKCEAVKGTGLKIFNANAATMLESLKYGVAGYSGVMANFHAKLWAWLVANWQKEPARAEELMAFLGAASMVECQVYPVNAKYHANLMGIKMDLMTRTQDPALLTGSKKLEIEQFYAVEQQYIKHFFG